jgi:anthranilate phosphoribosyltransferase
LPNAGCFSLRLIIPKTFIIKPWDNAFTHSGIIEIPGLQITPKLVFVSLSQIMTEHHSPQSRMRSYLQLVATGPELSKSLNRDQAEDAIGMILDGEIDPVRSGIFLIALRMKRETDAENLGALDALLKRTTQASAVAGEILAISDPFNGYNRGIPATPFLPAVFAACGLPAYANGLRRVGPKYGVTINMVLDAAGKIVDMDPVKGAAQLDNPDIGWTYMDQSVYAPALHELVGLREKMVKRCVISTLEVVLKPLSGNLKTHLMTGFVHKAYPPVYTALARHADYESAMIIRGVEGGSIPSLSQVSRYFGYDGNDEMTMHKLSPASIGIEQQARSISLEDEFETLAGQSGYENTQVLTPIVEKTVELGLAALSGKAGPMHDSLVYGAAIGLSHTGLCDSMEEGARIARMKLQSGEAADRFKNG